MLAFCIQLSTQGNSILLVLRVLFALELRHEIRRHSMCKFDHDCLWYIRSLLPCNLTFHPSFNKKSYLTFEFRPRSVRAVAPATNGYARLHDLQKRIEDHHVILFKLEDVGTSAGFGDLNCIAE